MAEPVAGLLPAIDDQILALLAKVAEQDILPYFNNLQKTDIETKSSDTDFVTIADRQSEKHLIQGLRAILPEAGFIAEEQVALHGLPAQLDTGYFWTIDPIDGTRNFVRGGTEFCTMLGLIFDGRPIAAWIYKPVTKDAIIAQIGKAVHYFGPDKQLSQAIPRKAASSLNDLTGSMNAMGFDNAIQKEVREKLKTLKGRFHVGSAGVEVMNIACAKADYLMHSKLTYWDSVPVFVILEALGFYARLGPDEIFYQPGDTGVLLAAENQKIWQELAHFIWSV